MNKKTERKTGMNESLLIVFIQSNTFMGPWNVYYNILWSSHWLECLLLPYIQALVLFKSFQRWVEISLRTETIIFNPGYQHAKFRPCLISPEVGRHGAWNCNQLTTLEKTSNLMFASPRTDHIPCSKYQPLKKK